MKDHVKETKVLGHDFFEGLPVEIIGRLEGLPKNCTIVYEYINYDGAVEFSYSWWRPMTEKELEKEEARRKAEREAKKRAKEKREAAEREVYEKLKAKYGSD